MQQPCRLFRYHERERDVGESRRRFRVNVRSKKVIGGLRKLPELWKPPGSERGSHSSLENVGARLDVFHKLPPAVSILSLNSSCPSTEV
jgi:hypothetical protein